MIINLRGTNGSGKTTVAKSFIDNPLSKVVELGSYPQKRGPKIIPGYVTPDGVVVVGSYATACGGCDSIPTQDLIKSCVREAAKHGEHVLFEGVLVSTIFSGWMDFTVEMANAGHTYTWAFMDTPLPVCLDRIQQRNGGKPINENLVANKVRSINATAQKARMQMSHVVGFNVVDIPHQDSVPAVRSLFGLGARR